jgi:c-di-AMP phosphodiesterase-like protein
MNKKTKVIILRYLISFIIFLIVWIILHFSFENLENPYKVMISTGIMAILSPRIKEYETQSGKQMQVKWIFLRKPISI